MTKIIKIPLVKRSIVMREDFILMLMRSAETDKIILPDNLKNDSEVVRFEVIQNGPKVKDIHIGDCLVVSPGAMIKFQFDGQVYFVTKEENVTAILRKEESLQ